MGKRCQIARSAERALLIYHWEYIFVIKMHQTLDGSFLYAAKALSEAQDFEQQHYFDNLLWNRIAETGSVRAYKILLQLAELTLVDTNIAEATEAGIDTVENLSAINLLFQKLTICPYAAKCIFRQTYFVV